MLYNQIPTHCPACLYPNDDHLEDEDGWPVCPKGKPVSEHKIARHLRDVSMDNIAQFLGDEFAFEKTDYIDQGENFSYCNFETKDGQKFTLIVRKD